MGWWSNVDWGSVAGAAASIYGSNKAASAAKDAGKTAAAGSDAATALQGRIYDDQRALNQPFYQSQLSALNQYNALMGLPQVQQQAPQPQSQGPFDPNSAYLQANPDVAASAFNTDPRTHWLRYGRREGRAWPSAPAPQQAAPQQPALTQEQAFAQFRNQPGYQFGLDQGQKQIQSSAAARGGLLSGAALKALQKHGTDYADQQGFTPYINRIASAAGIGQVNPVGNLQNAGSQYASNAGGFMQNAANSRASGMLNAANARQQGYADAAGFLGSWYGGRG